MEKKNLSDIFGTYSPTFFKMHLDVYHNLEDINAYDENTSALFVHEYIHYLQDITTTFGYMNISMVVDYIKHVNGLIISSPNDRFIPPILPTPSYKDNVYYNNELRKIYLGTSFDEDEIIEFELVPHPKEIFLPEGNESVERYKIEYRNKLNQDKIQYFGAYAILESMAFIIEDILYPNIIKCNKWPYRLAEQIVKKIYHIMLSNRLNVLALCDASLFTYNPAEMFVGTLVRMEAEKYCPQNPEEIYSYCLEGLKFGKRGETSANELYEMNCRAASDQIQSYFTTTTFKDNKSWIENIFDNSRTMRKNNPLFFLQIAQNGPLKSNKTLHDIIKIFGTPMITNLHNDACILHPGDDRWEVHPEYLWAINEIYRLYTHSIDEFKKCALCEFCRLGCHDQKIYNYTNSKCYEPWTRVDDEMLCPFATIWKTWGLENVILE